MDLFYVFVSGYQFRRPVSLVSLFYVLFSDTSSGDLYALLVCFMFCFRIRAQKTRKPCYLIFVFF